MGKRRVDGNRANRLRNGQRENDKVAYKPVNIDEGDGNKD